MTTRFLSETKMTFRNWSTAWFCPSGENNILQIMVKVVKGVRPDLGAVPRCRPSTCTGFLTLMQRCWATKPEARPSFQGRLCLYLLTNSGQPSLALQEWACPLNCTLCSLTGCVKGSAMALLFLFVLHNPIPAVNATWPWDVVVPEITSEAEELCSKPQEEPKSPRLSTSDPEPMTPKALTGDQVRYDSEAFAAFTWQSYMCQCSFCCFLRHSHVLSCTFC